MGDDRHFVTGDFKSYATFFMNDEDYAKVLDNIVVACVDCIIVNEKGEMLLGERIKWPHPDWWIIGGRMMPGESFEAATARVLKRELNLSIEPNRFSYFGTYSFVWARRAQVPEENGCHMIAIVMVLHTNNDEIKKIKPNEEHRKLKWIRPEEITADFNFHPAIRKYADELRL